MCDCLVAVRHAAVTEPAYATLFAKNSDRPPAEAQRVEWHPARREDVTRTTYLAIDGAAGETIGVLGSRPEWMWGFEHGVNEAGVAAGNETIYTTLDPRGFPDALTGMDLVRLALERASTAMEAVGVITTMLDRHGQGGSGHRDRRRPYWSSFLVADPSDAWVVETSGREWEAERVGTGGTRAISNRTTIPSFDRGHRHPQQPVETLVDPRLDASRAVLASHPVTAAALRAHLRSHVGGADGWTVCMHVDGVEATTAAIVAELPAAGHPFVASMLVGSPCRSIFVPLVVGQPIGDPVPVERFAALPAGDHETVARLHQLEAELARDVAEEPGWNAHAWRRVAQVLDEREAAATAR